MEAYERGNMRFQSSRGSVPALIFLLLVACSDGTAPEPLTSGNWSASYTDDATECGGIITEGTVDLLIVQTGIDLRVTSAGLYYTGTLIDTEGTWSATYRGDGGVISEEFTVTFTDNNTVLSGGSTWTWTDGVADCSGTSTIEASK